MAFARLERDAWTDPSVARAYAELWREFVAPAIPRLLDAALVGPNDRLLDVAAGPWPVSLATLGRGARPVAFDFSGPMLRSVGRKVPRVQGDAGSLPFRDQSFDRVVSNLGLLHFPDPEKAVGEAARVVKPGGVVAFSVWGPDATALTVIPQALQAQSLASPAPSGPGFFRFGEPGAFEATMRSAGLIPLPSERIAWEGVVVDSEVFWRMFRDGTARTRASIRRLSADEQVRLHDEVVRRLARYDTDHGLAIPTTVVVGRGRRP